MLRWEGNQFGSSHPDRVGGDRSGHQERGPPDPREWEAHRRHRTFDERGVIQDETHEAIRIKYNRRASPGRQLAGRTMVEPPVAVTIILAGMLHGACWFAVTATWAFAPSPWLALLWVPFIGFFMGLKFLAAQIFFVHPLGGLLLGLDGWLAWSMILPIAGLMAPGKWIRGEW